MYRQIAVGVIFALNWSIPASSQPLPNGGSESCKIIGDKLAGPLPNLSKLFSILKTEKLAKSQYETNDQFQRRMSSSGTSSSYVWAGTTIDSSLGVYNAEDKTLNYNIEDFDGEYLSTEYNRDGGDSEIGKKYHGLTGLTVKQPSGQYVGANGFGARRLVHSSSKVVYEVAFSEVRQHELGTLGELMAQRAFNAARQKITIPIPVDVARRDRSKLMLFIGGTVSPPSTFSTLYSREATFDDPREVNDRINVIVIDEPCGAIFDPVSKTVLTTFQFMKEFPL